MLLLLCDSKVTVKLVRGAAAAAVEERGIAGNCCCDKQHMYLFNHLQITIQRVYEQVMLIPDVQVVRDVI